MVGHASHTISSFRKKNLKPSLSAQFSALYNPNRPTTKYLLGDDLNKCMQEAQESSKLAKTYSSSAYTKRFEKSQEKTSFLGRGKKPNVR